VSEGLIRHVHHVLFALLGGHYDFFQNGSECSALEERAGDDQRAGNQSAPRKRVGFLCGHVDTSFLIYGKRVRRARGAGSGSVPRQVSGRPPGSSIAEGVRPVNGQYGAL
jgi:hypothetical protein